MIALSFEMIWVIFWKSYVTSALFSTISFLFIYFIMKILRYNLVELMFIMCSMACVVVPMILIGEELNSVSVDLKSNTNAFIEAVILYVLAVYLSIYTYALLCGWIMTNDDNTISN